MNKGENYFIKLNKVKTLENFKQFVKDIKNLRYSKKYYYNKIKLISLIKWKDILDHQGNLKSNSLNSNNNNHHNFSRLLFSNLFPNYEVTSLSNRFHKQKQQSLQQQQQQQRIISNYNFTSLLDRKIIKKYYKTKVNEMKQIFTLLQKNNN